MIEGIKVFGERNSGNNYIMHLLDKNLNLKYTTRERFINKGMGWTHGKPREPAFYECNAEMNKILFLFIFKNPYSWLLSFKEKPHTHELNAKFKKTNFFGFLQTPCEGYKNPVLMLMNKYKNYLAFESKHKRIIKYESALQDPKGFINSFDKVKDRILIKLIESKTHASGRLLEEKFDKKEYYLKEQWREKLGVRDIAFINEHLDIDVMNQLGYEWI